MKESISSLCHYFNTNRMVAEYTDRFYMPALKRYNLLSADDFAEAKDMAAWRRRLHTAWSQVRVESVEGDLPTELHVGESFNAQARVSLGDLAPEDVRVELYVGLVNSSGELVQGEAMPMVKDKDLQDNRYLYKAEAVCEMSGLHGYTVRVLPYHKHLVTPFQPGFIRWAG
jgi:starch phosphorylase